MSDNEPQTQHAPHWANWIAPIVCSLINLLWISPYRFFGSEFDRLVAPVFLYFTLLKELDFYRLYWQLRLGWQHAFWLLSVPVIISFLVYRLSYARYVWGWVYAASWLLWQVVLFGIFALAVVLA